MSTSSFADKSRDDFGVAWALGSITNLYALRTNARNLERETGLEPATLSLEG